MSEHRSWSPNYASAAEKVRWTVRSDEMAEQFARFIVDAALDGLALLPETEEDYVCCAKQLPARHEPEIVTRRRWVSPWEPFV